MEYEIQKDFTINNLIKLYDEGKLNLNPPYQRKDIWSPRDKKSLIDSIIKGYPIQNFYIIKVNHGFDVVDGQQRTRAILGFYKNKFPSDQMIYFDELKQPEKSQFLDYKLELAIITSLNNGDTIEDFYSRVNSTGKRLNRPELKKAKYFDTRFLNLIHEISDLSDFQLLDLFSKESLNRMNDMDFISELLALIKSGITEKKLEVDNIFESDISTKEYASLLKEFKQILSHFSRFNKIEAIKNTRYKQKNDFYTLFGFIRDNLKLKNATLDVFYRTLVYIGVDISPSTEECFPLYDYALNCVSQSNSKDAREKRINFLGSLFLNKTDTVNKEQKAILKFYGLESKDAIKVEDFTIINIEKLKSVTGRA